MITSCEKEPIEVKESLSKFIIYDTYKEDEVEYKLRTDYDLIYKGFLLEKINVRKISIPQYLDSTEVVSEGTILFRYNVDNVITSITIDKRDLWLEQTTKNKMFCKVHIEKQLFSFNDSIIEKTIKFENTDFESFEAVVSQAKNTSGNIMFNKYKNFGFRIDENEYLYTYDELNRLTSIQHRSNDILNYANRWSPYSGNKVYPISEITYSTESRISQIVTNTNSLEDNIEFISYSEYDNPFYQINSDLGYPFIKDFLLFGDKLPAEFKKGVLLTSYGQLKVETENGQVKEIIIDDNIIGTDEVEHYAFEYERR